MKTISLVFLLAGSLVAVFPVPAGEVSPLQQAEQLLRDVGLEFHWSVSQKTAAAVAARGIGERELQSLLEQILAPCLSQTTRCQDSDVLDRQQAQERTDAVEGLLALLGELGSPASFPLLLRIDARGIYAAHRAEQKILTRAMLAAVENLACTPPTPAEIEAAKKALGGFLKLRVEQNHLVAAAPTASELEDLVYFSAAIREEGPEVGATKEQGKGFSAKSKKPNPGREEIFKRLESAKLRGDIPEIAKEARAYLETLGLSGPTWTADEKGEDEYYWGGARFSYVMRDLAGALEMQGQFDQASRLYRHANPGGGLCGTSVDVRWEEQIKGVIRSEERLGRCRAAVAERLLAVGSGTADAYGTERLAKAGFDVVRLFRGALVTINRDGHPDLVKRALATTSREAPPLRYLERGPEDWERRVFGIEGYADAAQREALPGLLDAAFHGIPSVRIRAIHALEHLAERPASDPCHDRSEWLTIRPFGVGGPFDRNIRPLGRSCASVLKPEEANKLAEQLLPLLKEENPDLREAAAKALGAIGATTALPELRRLLNDAFQPEGVQVCDTKADGVERCRRPFPVREAAQQAIEKFLEVEKSGAGH